MKINGIEALQEEVQGSVYVMTFPGTPPGDLQAPFVITTPKGEEVYTIGEFTVPLRKEIDLPTGITNIIFGKPDEREIKIQTMEKQIEVLTEKLVAEQAFSAIFEAVGPGVLSHMMTAEVEEEVTDDSICDANK